MATIAYAGNYIGTVVAMPISGVMAASVGWESLFYLFGVIGCIWFLLWMVLIKSSPEKDPWISDGELQYIKKSLAQKYTMPHATKFPWKAVLISKPVYAIIASQFAELWGFYTMLTQLPSFLRGKFGLKFRGNI
jgi:ACS family sodium-dependent inorganic phosphate cotransporter